MVKLINNQDIGAEVMTPEFGVFVGVGVQIDFFFKFRTPEESTTIEEIGRIKGCSNVFDVISKYPGVVKRYFFVVRHSTHLSLRLSMVIQLEIRH